METSLYPIKYAVMPVTNYAKNDNFVLGFIVTKAYVVSETIRYTDKGKRCSYEVVYPVKGVKSSEVMADLRVPEFDESGMCINADFNKDVFDDMETAHKVCDEKNSLLFHENITYYSEKKKFIQEFELSVLSKTFQVPNPEDVEVSTQRLR